MEAIKDPIEIAGLVGAGEINPLEAYIILKELQGKTELAIKQVLDSALTEAGKYPEKSFKAYGAKIEVRNGPSTFKFCEAILNYKAKLKQLEEQSKLGEFADPDSGEIISKAIKTEGKTTLSISFK
jgi:hypothetical protein